MMKRHTRVREIAMIIITIIFFVAMLTFCSWYESTYTREAVVSRQENNVTYFVDITGNEWTCEDCYGEEGESVKLIMDTNGTTDYIYDDIIKDIKWIEQ